MTIDLNDKVSVITAAGNGIGRASALEFARLGAKVVASDIDLAAVEATVRDIRAAGGDAIA
ncbi:MAG TPA: SDR family NAD(P)-dependent oxidoreductase, partial [Pseudomonadales bacterium]|nr:SDR family NAD(P)-dependent oxidoreductase [Pseudomonadales bacterium]